jgi:hypothetical protein
MNVRNPRRITFSAIKVGKFVVFSVLTICLWLPASAQSYGEVGVMAGGSYYIGDLNPEKHFLLTRPAFGAFLRHNFNERFATKIAGTFSTIEGDDIVSEYSLDRALNFKSNVIDINATFEINFFDYFIGSQRSFITPYWYGGIGVIFFEPKSRNSDINLTKLEIRTENVNYKTMALSIPFGIGIKYSLNNMYGISLHWGMQKTFTDFLDDVSTVYYLPAGASSEFINIADPTGQHSTGMQRGNSKSNDWYSIAGISLTRKINYLSKEKCINVYF